MSPERPTPPAPAAPRSVPPGPAPGAAGAPTGVPPSVRAQLLATEHWSLLATRSMTRSEVMSRIGIHLTVTSASLVVLALVAQATGFGTPFRVLSIGVASAVLLLETLTAMRVHNASVDDAALVLGMNRLRAAYVQMDPTLSDHLVTSWYDDAAGLMRTYTMGSARSTLSHVAAGTSMFMTAVNTIVAGTLGALVAEAAGARTGVVVGVGCAAGVVCLGAFLEHGRRSFDGPVTEPRFPQS